MQTVWKLFPNPKSGYSEVHSLWIMRRVPISVVITKPNWNGSKNRWLKALNISAKLTLRVASPVPSPKPYGYRSTDPHYEKNESGQFRKIGFLRRGFRKIIIDVPNCPIAARAHKRKVTYRTRGHSK